MTFYVAATVTRYVALLAELGRTGPLPGELDIRATAAIDAGIDLPPADLLRLFDHLTQVGPGDIAMRCGSGRRLAELGIVGHAIASCRTLGAALRLAVAHDASGDAFRRIEYLRRGSEWIAEIRIAAEVPHRARRLMCEEWIAAFFAYLAEVTRITRPQVRIELDYAPLPGVDYARWLPATPAFGRRHCRLVLPARLLDHALVSYDHDMLQLVLRHFAERPVGRDSFEDRVERYLVLHEGEPPRLAGAAAHIGVSTRTLVRRLAEEGTNYGAILERHRRGYALALARDARIGLKQISATLGFRSEQSFKRAFAQWTGTSLRRWRHDEGIGARPKQTPAAKETNDG